MVWERVTGAVVFYGRLWPKALPFASQQVATATATRDRGAANGGALEGRISSR